MRQETGRRIRNILYEDFNANLGELDNSRKFEDLKMDSLDMTGLAIALEESFDILIPKEDIKKLVTIDDAINYVEAKLRG